MKRNIITVCCIMTMVISILSVLVEVGTLQSVENRLPGATDVMVEIVID